MWANLKYRDVFYFKRNKFDGESTSYIALVLNTSKQKKSITISIILEDNQIKNTYNHPETLSLGDLYMDTNIEFLKLIGALKNQDVKHFKEYPIKKWINEVFSKEYPEYLV